MKKYLSAVLALALCAGLFVPASAAGQTFTDVPANHWASEAVDYAVSKGYFSGTGSNTFSPDGTMTRAMLWTVLSRMDGYTGTAGPGDPWYQNGRDWAMANGISDGTNPDGNITREQFATMLRNFAKHTGTAADVDNSVLDRFTDRDSIAAYAVDAMAWAVNKGIISGTSGSTISPVGLATRSQAATMLMRFDQMGEVEPSTPSKPVDVTYKTTFAAINVPPYPGDTIQVGEYTYVTIASNPYGANTKAGVTYTVTSSDTSVATVSATLLNPDEVSFRVSGLKAGKVTLTAIGSDGFKGTITITVKGAAEQGTPTVDMGKYAKEKAEMIRLTNEERERNGLPALQISERLMEGAQIRAEECTISYSHTRPDGKPPIGSAEIINAATWLDVRGEVQEWIESTGHHQIMLTSRFNYIGVGVARGSDGMFYYVELFSMNP